MAEIRRAEPGDTSDLVEIEQSSFREPRVNLILGLCGISEYLIVFDSGGYIAGYVLGAPVDSDVCRIVSIAVRHGYRRNGVGTELMGSIMDRMRNRGFSEMILEVRVSNSEAQSLYSSLGFRAERKIFGYYGDGEDALVMKKSL